MPWAAVASAVVASYAAAKADEAQEAQEKRTPQPKREKPLDQIVREHNARIAAETVSTVRQARIGAFLLLAVVIAAGACVYQLFT